MEQESFLEEQQVGPDPLTSPAGRFNNPALGGELRLSPNPSPFGNLGTQVTRNRRAVYGLRRRRMPYGGTAEFGSINPFRRPNSFFNNPQDFVFPRQMNPMWQALHPASTDYAKKFKAVVGGSPYGGFSSFRNNLRRFEMAQRAGMPGASSVPPGAVGPLPTIGFGGDKVAGANSAGGLAKALRGAREKVGSPDGSPFFNAFRPALNYRQGQFRPAGLENGASQPGRRSGFEKLNEMGKGPSPQAPASADGPPAGGPPAGNDQQGPAGPPQQEQAAPQDVALEKAIEQSS